MRLSLNKSATEMFYFPLDPALPPSRQGDHRRGARTSGRRPGRDHHPGRRLRVLTTDRDDRVAPDRGRRRLARGVVSAARPLRDPAGPQHAPAQARSRADLGQRCASGRCLKEMVRLVESPYERPTLYGMDLLEETALRLLEKRLPRLLEHRSPKVRARALTLLSSRQTEDARSRCARCSRTRTPRSGSRRCAAQVALGERAFTPRLEEYLEPLSRICDPPRCACWSSTASPADEPRMMEILKERLRDGTSAEQAEIADALGHAARPTNLSGLLEPLLESHDLDVRRSAMRSAGRVMGPEAIPAPDPVAGRSRHHGGGARGPGRHGRAR